ncbi:Copper resistance protein CopC [Candidatus Methylobacter favarea]|uniref:Copper resistance protein C n=1 Tax=Candidatus Methylobacter favarea TaxID=2707345 RepID=A0A8S0WLI6_9GAMM|nr:copper resistance protein CopC [Candidatus Methylobacter favarea]CAA9889250.1 Copper resistance protein CopC [Candidatus Methylobacter favarea]
MKNTFQLSLLFILLIQPPLLFAHAVITSHSLKIAPLRPARQEKVELTFNSQIELGLSQIFLVHKGDKHELLHAVKGRQQGHIIVDIPPLKTGHYAIRFRIFAADGHLTEDVIHFTVEALPSDTKAKDSNSNSSRF